MCAMERRKLLALLFLMWSVVCVTECVQRRRRSETCDQGFYNTSDGIECCQCRPGTHLVEDCTSHRGFAKCELCEAGTYQEHQNTQKKCEPCRTCSSSENKVEESRCSPSKNTECRCQDNHYCDKGCKVCHQCSTCEHGIKVDCTLSSDTQCNEKPADNSAIISVVVVFIILGVCLGIFCIWKKKLFCFKLCETPENPKLELLELLDDHDLEPCLSEIAGSLGINVVQTLVKRMGGLTRAQIDNIIDENPRDANERADQLLHAWYQKHGIQGAHAKLYHTLIKMNMKVQAKQVLEIIQARRSSEERQNGHV